MPETFDYATADPGSSGENFAGDRISQGGTSKFLPACYLVFGPQDGGYTRVDTGAGLPVAVQGTVPVSGTFWQATQPVSLASVPTHAVTQSGSWTVTADTELPAAAALADSTPNPTVPGVGCYLMAWDGSGWNRVMATPDLAANTPLQCGLHAYNPAGGSWQACYRDDDGNFLVFVRNNQAVAPPGAAENALVVREPRSGTIATGQVSCGTSATSIVSARNRRRLVIRNNGANPVYVGAGAVTTSTGYKLAVNESLTLETSTSVFGIVAASTESVSYIEEF